MPIKYTRVGWQDAPSMETPIDAANLNHMDNGILALSEAYDVEVPTIQEQFQDMLKEVSELKQLVNQRCYVGMIIHSTTLSTEAKVIAEYGGEHWIQHTGYFLYGDNAGVTDNNAVADGGEATHTLTANEMPTHNHGEASLNGAFTAYAWNTGHASGIVSNASSNVNVQLTFGSDIGLADYRVNASHTHSDNGGGQAHNNMPPYKKVYIWECVVVDSGDNPILIEDA